MPGGIAQRKSAAWAAQHFAARGKRVLYVDLDAHHGDGVEALTRTNPAVMTCSVHDSTIFPGTGHQHSPSDGVFNYPLASGAGDPDLLQSIEAIVGRARSWQPDILLIAIGADGHATVPLSSLQYTYDGDTRAAEALGTLAAELATPVLLGGAGGYQPHTHTCCLGHLRRRPVHSAQHTAPPVPTGVRAASATRSDPAVTGSAPPLSFRWP